MPENYKIQNDKKYIWDGKVYETETEAENIAVEYKKDNFETLLCPDKESGKYYVYSRRKVESVIVEGQS